METDKEAAPDSTPPDDTANPPAKKKMARNEVKQSEISGDIGDMKKRFKFKNPITVAKRSMARRKIKQENHFLRREETMKQDTERYLMELEEEHTWLAYELRARNAVRMRKEHEVRELTKQEAKKDKKKQLDIEMEQGLSYFRGEIINYRCWQNSEAKHLDITGHTASVNAVKLSSCLKYIISCSFDKTAKLWSLANGKCLYTFVGHTKKVNDCDIHVNFQYDSMNVGVVTCGSDAMICYWNCTMPSPLKTVTGHSEAVYRCSFSPDGQRVVSCSEDMTSRVWSVPEGFMLFVFRAHTSPVSTVKFSPSGKYLISGSDYGERRLMLWNARSPVFKETTQLPHMVYWNEQGLITKILFHKQTPDEHFWLTNSQLGQLPDDELVMTWQGETDSGEDIESDSDSDAEDDDAEFEEEDNFGKDDIREVKGATVGVIQMNKDNEKVEATEYIAGGGSLVITLQSIFIPIAEAFVSVQFKEQQFDSYGTQSGDRAGTFKASDPIPWREFYTDPLNIKPPCRMAPKTITETCQRKAFVYNEHRKYDQQTGEEIFDSVAVEMLWQCPPPNMGAVVVTVNFRLRTENFRRKLTYSLRESPIRMNTLEGDDDVVAEDGARYLFDQEERHMIFFRFIQDRNWQAVESFLAKKCFIYFEAKRFIRRRRTIEMLQRLFGKTKKTESIVAGVDSVSEKRIYNDLSEEENIRILREEHEKEKRLKYLDELSRRPIIVASPFIHLAGNTRSSVMCEDLDPFQDKKSMALEAQLEAIAKQKKKEEKLKQKAARKEEKKRQREERKRKKAQAAADETAEQHAARVLKEKQKAELDGLSVEEGKDSDSSDDSDDSSDNSGGSSSGSSSYETDSNGSYVSDSDSDGDDYGDDEREPSVDMTLPPIIEEDGDPSSPHGKQAITTTTTTNDDTTKDTHNGTTVVSQHSSIATADSIHQLTDPSSAHPDPLTELGAPLIERRPGTSNSINSNNGNDNDDDSLSLDSDDETKAPATLREALQVMPRIIYTEPVEGESFLKKVKKIAKAEVTKASTLQLLGHPNPNELRQHTTQGHSAKSLLTWGNAPEWVREQRDDVEAKREAVLQELEANSGMGNHREVEDPPDIKDDIFGPRFDGLSMKLPNIFPSKAGKRKEALKHTLKKNEKSQQKEKKRRIPTPEEAYEIYEAKKKKKKNYFKKPNFLQKRDAKKKEAHLLEDEIKLHVLVNSGYPTARRLSMPALPGMSEHYPNPTYTHGALIPNGFNISTTTVETKTNFISSMFGKSKESARPLLLTNDDNNTVSTPMTTFEEEAKRDAALIKEGLKIAKKFPSVGNKPLSFSTIQKKMKPKKFKKKKKIVDHEGDASVARTAQEEEDEEEEGEEGTSSEITGGSRHSSMVASRRQSRRSSRHSANEGRRRSRPSVSSQLSQFHSHVSFEEGDSQSKKGGTKLTTLTENVEGTAHSDLHPALLASLEYIQADDFSASMTPLNVDVDANEFYFNDSEKKSNSHIPKDVYLGRRGSYMLAPGLESFQATNGLGHDEEDEDKGETDTVTMSAFTKKKMAKNASTFDEHKTVNKKIEAPGLICVMHTKGFNIAHQGGINDAVFAPSESRVASCGGDHLIKIWDTTDGSYVRTLQGHDGEVTCMCYTEDELYLVSAGGDMAIIIWDMALFSVTRVLRGHVDVVNSLAISNDASFIVSGSYDSVIKTWFLTPRVPEAPLPPKIITKTNNTVMIHWVSPPSFNEPITAFFLQYRIPGQDYWSPEDPFTIPPTYRQKTLKGLPPCTTYQYRLKASNRMGDSEWGNMSKQVTTLMGKPLALERPEVCDVSSTSMSIFFFSPNPSLYGAAPHTFKIEWSGAGVEFDDTSQMFTLEEGLDAGAKIVTHFNFWTSPDGIKMKKSSKRSEQGKGGGGKGGAIAAFEVSTEMMSSTVERTQSLEDVLVSATITGLKFGKLYRIRVAGINDSGESPWSEASYSTPTLPGLPVAPVAPYRVDRGLTWLRLQWDPPDDSGSAIIGYRIFIKHRSYYMDVPRWQVTYEMNKLLPGQSYHLKVLAKNVVGWTEYSPYNSDLVGETATAVPDTPQNPTPYTGGWGFIRLKVQIPFGNGRDATVMFCQKRTVQSFSKSQWEKDLRYDLNDPKQITYGRKRVDKKISAVQEVAEDSDSDSDDLSTMSVAEIAKLKKKKLFAKMKVQKRPVIKRAETKMATGKLELLRQETGVETEIEKEEGRTIMFQVDNLIADTQYEFRVCFSNEAGRSEYSIPSQRSKTNRATVPDVCNTPRCVDLMQNHLIMGFQAPSDGGNTIVNFMLKVECMDRDEATGKTSIQTLRVMAHFSEYKIENLNTGGSYRVCVRADNDVGEGPFSTWTKVYTLPNDNDYGKKGGKSKK